MDVRVHPTDSEAVSASTQGLATGLAQRKLACLVAAVALIFPFACKAQGLQLGTLNVPITVPTAPTTLTVPTNVLGSVVNVPLSLVTGAVTNTLNISGTSITVPINLLGNTLNVSVSVPGTTISVAAGPVTINVPISLDAPISINLPIAGIIGTVNALDAIAAVRRNDILLGLDLGLDRQLDILTAGSSYWEDPGGLWSEPSALGGPRPSAAMLDAWGGGSSLRLPYFGESFAVSLQQFRQASAAASSDTGDTPYRLGATSRAAPPVRSAFDVWAEGAISRFNDGRDQTERHGQLGVVYIGADYRLSRDVLVGTLVQYNETSHDLDALQSGGSDKGWMIGPYATVRLTNNLFFQARAAWGKTDVKVDLDDTHQDGFDAERWLVRGTLLGQWRFGPWQFRPRASVGYVEERQESYESSLGTAIPSQTIALGQAKAGPEIAYRYRLANGSILEPSLLVEGVWNFLRDGGSLNIDDVSAADKIRGRAEAGLSLRTPSGAMLGAAISYDGIGSGDYQAVGGKLRMQLPFN